jgi:putative transposase
MATPDHTADAATNSTTSSDATRSFEDVEFATLEWVHCFNDRRLLEPIANIPPAEAEANYHAKLETRAVAA